MANSFYPLYTKGQLDPLSEAILDQIAKANGNPFSSLTPQQARECFLPQSWIGAPIDGIQIDEEEITGKGGGIPVRIYTPKGKPPFPITIFYHGGGFVLGTLEEFDPFCSRLAAGARCIVVSVGYRLAPEHKHPAAVEDAIAALYWVTAHAEEIHGDRTRMAVAGDSAGGNLAAVTSMIARDQGGPCLVCQVLICPWVDLSTSATESFRVFGEGLWLSEASIHWYRSHYLESMEQSLHPRVSPLLMNDLSRLPPTLIVIAEFDVLRDQEYAYAERLQEGGVSVSCTQYDGMIHDFPTVPGLFNRAQDAIDEICMALRMAFMELSKTDKDDEDTTT